jgi:hypothetical protein
MPASIFVATHVPMSSRGYLADALLALHFEWSEKSGDGAPLEPTRHGFGMELLTRILPYDLGARTSVEFRGNGLRFQMALPSEHVAELGAGPA